MTTGEMIATKFDSYNLALKFQEIRKGEREYSENDILAIAEEIYNFLTVPTKKELEQKIVEPAKNVHQCKCKSEEEHNSVY